MDESPTLWSRDPSLGTPGLTPGVREPPLDQIRAFANRLWGQTLHSLHFH